jgi:hypothetical protein
MRIHIGSLCTTTLMILCMDMCVGLYMVFYEILEVWNFKFSKFSFRSKDCWTLLWSGNFRWIWAIQTDLMEIIEVAAAKSMEGSRSKVAGSRIMWEMQRLDLAWTSLKESWCPWVYDWPLACVHWKKVVAFWIHEIFVPWFWVYMLWL